VRVALRRLNATWASQFRRKLFFLVRAIGGDSEAEIFDEFVAVARKAKEASKCLWFVAAS